MGYFPVSNVTIERPLYASPGLATSGQFNQLRTSVLRSNNGIDFPVSIRPDEIGVTLVGAATATHSSADSAMQLAITSGASDSALAESHANVFGTQGFIAEVGFFVKFGAISAGNRWEVGVGDGTYGFAVREEDGLSIVIQNPGFPGGELVIPQANWNIDALDGVTTLSDAWHAINFRCGASTVQPIVEIDGVPLQILGLNTIGLSTPYDRWRMRARALNVGGGTGGNMRVVVMTLAAMVQEVSFRPWSATRPNDVAVGTTGGAVIAVRPKSIVNGIGTIFKIAPLSIDLRSSSGAALFDIYYVWSSASTLAGATWANSGGPFCQFDTAASTFTPGASGVQVVGARSVASNASATIELDNMFGLLGKSALRVQAGAGAIQEYIVVTARTAIGTSNVNATVAGISPSGE